MASFGFVVLYSAAGGSVEPWAGRHMIRFLIFLAMAIVFSRLKENFWKTTAFPVYIIIVVMLLGVELIGAVSGGSQRWLNLGIIRIQPSELMKPAIILAVARFYDLLPPTQIRTWGAIWPLLVLVAVPSALILLQPDLGTTITVVAGALTVAFLAGLPMRLFIGGAAALSVIAPLAFFFGLEEYQQRRVTTFINPENDPLGAGYHITQSKIAIGSGGIFGKGFLNGTQSHLDYLPEGHTDFVFATMAEEWGLVGGMVILFGFFLLFRWGLAVSIRANSRFAKLTAAGLTTTIFFYVAINLMMVMGLAPVVGIPLPFLSHGGSSMMTIMICVGILMSIDRNPGKRGGAFG
ncbi:rod shape-determining protein RodA [Parasphingorhabdus halotolerans]|uniref:Peptidoglycan glycosyltransferase MrdB n=1 Tax=Parasphingorhabdus halotolerans TaxID=2725558 RepID=A0A6H2DQM6_9SPHN|nr:rod shape-determining protein RodA [Parasphingorhabdus halotolerans]QJB70634.1 rod shape-determining protein RodA [Parasphingorhabdus halotolerans]